MLKYCKEWINDKSSKELDISNEISKILLITKLDCGLSWIKHSATELASFAKEKKQDKVVQELEMIVDDVNQELNAIKDMTSKDKHNTSTVTSIIKDECMNFPISLLMVHKNKHKSLRSFEDNHSLSHPFRRINLTNDEEIAADKLFINKCKSIRLKCSDRDIVHSTQWFDDAIIEFWSRWILRYQPYDVQHNLDTKEVTILLPVLIHNSMETFHYDNGVNNEDIVVNDKDVKNDEENEVNKNNNGGDEQDDIDFDDLCEYKVLDFIEGVTPWHQSKLTLIPININQTHRFLILLYRGDLYETYVYSVLHGENKTHHLNPHFLIIDPMYDYIQQFHNDAIAKINDCLRNHYNESIAESTAEANRNVIVNHSMLNFSKHNNHKRDCGIYLCIYMWMIYKHYVGKRISKTSLDDFQDQLRNFIDNIMPDDILIFRFGLTELMDNIMKYHSRYSNDFFYYSLNDELKKFILEEEVNDDEYEEIFTDFPYDKFDQQPYITATVNNDDMSLDYIENLAKAAVNRSYKNTIKDHERRLSTLNNTLNVLEEKLKNPFIHLEHREKHRIIEKRKKTMANISKRTYLIANTTDRKLISSNIINGTDKIYAFKKNPTNNMYSFLVKHPSVGKLIQKDVDMDVLQKEYLDMINELATKFEDTIDPTQWLFVKKNNKETVFETGCEATVKKYFNKNHTLPFLRQNKLSYIGMVRILLTVNGEYNINYKQHCPIKSVDFKFHVLTCNRNNETNDHKYVFLSEEDLCDICHKDSVKTWKQTALKHFLTCFKTKGMVKYPNDDNNDPEFLTNTIKS